MTLNEVLCEHGSLEWGRWCHSTWPVYRAKQAASKLGKPSPSHPIQFPALGQRSARTSVLLKIYLTSHLIGAYKCVRINEGMDGFCNSLFPSPFNPSLPVSPPIPRNSLLPYLIPKTFVPGSFCPTTDSFFPSALSKQSRQCYQHFTNTQANWKWLPSYL